LQYYGLWYVIFDEISLRNQLSKELTGLNPIEFIFTQKKDELFPNIKLLVICGHLSILKLLKELHEAWNGFSFYIRVFKESLDPKKIGWNDISDKSGDSVMIPVIAGRIDSHNNKKGTASSTDILSDPSNK
jgi:hypothetical protein